MFDLVAWRGISAIVVFGGGMSDSEHEYALFRGARYYPSGGWEDLHKSYGEDLERARADVLLWIEQQETNNLDWWYHIVDLKTGEIVESRWG